MIKLFFFEFVMHTDWNIGRCFVCGKRKEPGIIGETCRQWKTGTPIDNYPLLRAFLILRNCAQSLCFPTIRYVKTKSITPLPPPLGNL